MKTLRVEYTSFSETPIPHIEEALDISWGEVAGWRVLRNVLFVDMLDGRKLAHPLNVLSEIDLDTPSKLMTTDSHKSYKSLTKRNSKLAQEIAHLKFAEEDNQK